MLTWISVVADAPTDEQIAEAIARRDSLTIRPLIDDARLRRAMGLDAVELVAVKPRTRRTSEHGKRAPRSKAKRVTPPSVAA